MAERFAGHEHLTLPVDLDVVYPLDDPAFAKERAFFIEVTGCHTPSSLKEHALATQHQAYTTFPYPCIRSFTWLRTKTAEFPVYQDILNIGQREEDAILIEVGCFFGTDLRKLVFDCYSARNIVGTDLRTDWFDMGHAFFKDKDTCQIKFIGGDIFSSTFFDPFADPSLSPATIVADLNENTGITPLVGRARVVVANLFFHLFPKERQFDLARRTAALLKPERGSIITGLHVACPNGKTGYLKYRLIAEPVFCLGVKEWKDMWEVDIFPASRDRNIEGVKVEVRAEVVYVDGFGYDLTGVEFEGKEIGDHLSLMKWSIVVT